MVEIVQIELNGPCPSSSGLNTCNDSLSNNEGPSSSYFSRISSGANMQRDSVSDCVKYRKCIRVISVIDFVMAFAMLFLLSFGFFPVRRDATSERSVQAFLLGMYGLYSVQMLVSIILYKGTHKVRPAVIVRSFKQWSTTSNVLNVMLCAEVYFFILIVDGRTLISMTLCFIKVIFRGIAVQIVNFSIREITDRHNLSTMMLSNSLNNNNSSSVSVEISGQNSDPSRFKPPPDYEYPPKYEEAVKMTMLKGNSDNDNANNNAVKESS